ncbi:bifunctional phosphoribosylaminoimidazolecarboxamide formyltransferase/inosine monophosphate cyclohydrolase, partial [Candidatus Woesearchaeota archaeon CG_4_10_14_0_8_um_filter_47_5]
TALLSVSDKTGIELLLKTLKKHGVRIISTGGTAQKIRELGYEVTDVSEVTGVPEYPSGLVKTLHPRIHFALLSDRTKSEHVKRMEEEGITPIDLVVCNLYPFERTVHKTGCTKEEAISQIDIGGVAMIRAAAKNHRFVAVVTDPLDYGKVCD